MDMKDQYRFILISSEKTVSWQYVLKRALAHLGQLEIMNERRALVKVASEFIDLVIIDSGEVLHIIPLITQLRETNPNTRVVIVTEVTTWRRAREAFHAGSSDYIVKSTDVNKIRAQIETALSAPIPPEPPKVTQGEAHHGKRHHFTRR